MRKFLILLALFLVPCSVWGIDLEKDQAIKVRIGPFVAVGDGFTPQTGCDETVADEAELLKADGAATVSLAAATLVAVSGADGWCDLSLTAAMTDTAGELVVVFQDDSIYLPVVNRFQVVDPVYEALVSVFANNTTTDTYHFRFYKDGQLLTADVTVPDLWCQTTAGTPADIIGSDGSRVSLTEIGTTERWFYEATSGGTDEQLDDGEVADCEIRLTHGGVQRIDSFVVSRTNGMISVIQGGGSGGDTNFGD